MIKVFITSPLLFLTISFSACKKIDNTPLPILGVTEIVAGDTVYHEILDFELMTSDSVKITNETLSEYIYIADFFFMSCPSICPKVMKQMKRLYKHYKTNDKVRFISFTLDPKRDTPSRLKKYAENLGVDANKWLFLTGDKDLIYDLAENHFVAAFEDAEAPGGFNHSGKILLVDTNRHIRAFAEGTDPDDVTTFFQDIDKLLAEYETE